MLIFQKTFSQHFPGIRHNYKSFRVKFHYYLF